MSLADFFHLQATTMGYRQRVIVIPNTLALATAKVGDLLRCCGIKTQLSTIYVKQLLVREYYCNNHATKHLHLPSSPISKAITDYFADHQARHKT